MESIELPVMTSSTDLNTAIDLLKKSKPGALLAKHNDEYRLCSAGNIVVGRLCLPKTLSGMTRGWGYGKEAADGCVSDPVAACYPVAVYEASAA